MQTGEGATRSTSSTAEARAARSKATASRVAPSEGQSKRKGGGQTAPAGSESEEALLERLSRVDKILKSPQAAAILRATSQCLWLRRLSRSACECRHSLWRDQLFDG